MGCSEGPAQGKAPVHSPNLQAAQVEAEAGGRGQQALEGPGQDGRGTLNSLSRWPCRLTGSPKYPPQVYIVFCCFFSPLSLKFHFPGHAVFTSLYEYGSK